jgi:hypothetical protein
MSDTGGQGMPDPVPARHRSRAMARLRAYFLTGLVIAAPLFLTVVITWWFIQWIDSLVTPFIPPPTGPTVLPYYRSPASAWWWRIVFITLLGFLTRNYRRRQAGLFRRELVGGCRSCGTFIAASSRFSRRCFRQAKPFQTVGLIEYPRKGLWSIVFIAADTRGEIQHHLNETVIGRLSADDAEPHIRLSAVRQAQRRHHSRHVAGRCRQAGHLRRTGDARHAGRPNEPTSGAAIGRDAQPALSSLIASSRPKR